MSSKQQGSAQFARSCLLSVAATALAASAIGGGHTNTAVQRPPASESRGIYADDPNHLWNRMHRQFNVRVAPGGEEHGWDDVDPLLWRETRYLLTEPSHSQAIRLLNEFLDTGGERLISDPVRRAVFQHDLWAVFDWLAEGAEGNIATRKALMPLVARLIRRVALTRDQIEHLPDNYATAVASHAFVDRFDRAHRDRAFLPRDILRPGGQRVVIGGLEPIAQHTPSS